MKKIILILAVIAAAAFYIVKKPISNSNSTENKDKGQVNIYIWAEYIPDTVYEKFEEETGIKVVATTYDSTDAMYSKMKITSGEGYDIVMSGMDYISLLKNDGLVVPLDKTKLNNFKNLDANYLNTPIDPKNEYTIPFMWGTSGFVVNSDKIKDFKNLSNAWKGEYKSNISMLNDIKMTMGLGLRSLGYSINTTKEEEIKAAYEKLKLLMPNIKSFDTENVIQTMVNGEADIAYTWNGLAYKLNQEDKKYQYIYLPEGNTVWIDSLLVLKSAKNVDNAYKFLDFLMRPDIFKMILDEYPYSSANKEAYKLLSDEVKNNEILYPKNLPKPEYDKGIHGAADVYIKYWNMLRAGE